MFDRIEVMQMAGGMARHAGERQVNIARNMANADTPGYRARDLPDFAATLDQGGLQMRATRPRHIAPQTAAGTLPDAIDRNGEPSPNGNTVSLETEMMQAAGVRQQHDMALSIYTSARDVLRASIGRR
jgi:flagellar basal-body rod protein FlgB